MLGNLEQIIKGVLRQWLLIPGRTPNIYYIRGDGMPQVLQVGEPNKILRAAHKKMWKYVG